MILRPSGLGKVGIAGGFLVFVQIFELKMMKIWLRKVTPHQFCYFLFIDIGFKTNKFLCCEVRGVNSSTPLWAKRFAVVYRAKFGAWVVFKMKGPTRDDPVLNKNTSC